jgi:hypothetical protein
MSFWSRFFGGNGTAENSTNNTSQSEQPRDIPEEVFTEKTAPAQQEEKQQEAIIRQDNIHTLYDFLSTDFQNLGYNDALVNPDTSYMRQNIEAILSDLEMTIKKVITFYQDAIEELNFLIESRSRMGMVDTVDELKMKRERAVRHMEKVKEMQSELSGEHREIHRVTISYKRGFHNGMAAIAHHESGKRSF